MWKPTLVLTAALLCLFSPLCYALSDVVVLDDTNFDIKTKSGDWFLEFYAPWCGHCKNLAPTWEELATSLKSKNINVGKIDCTENKVIGKRFGITGYPTIKFLKDSQLRDYSGSRRLNDFLTFSEEGYQSVTASPLPERLRDEIRPKVITESAPVPERTGPSDVVVLTASNFTSTISSGVWLVEFYAPWCGFCKKLAPIWEDLATKLKSSKVGVAKVNVNDPENKILGRAFDIKGYPTIKYVKDGTYRDFAGERTVEGFTNFVESGYKKLPSKPLPTPSFFEELLSTYLGWVEPIAEPYAEMLMDNVAVVIVVMTFFGALVGFFIGRLSAPTSYVIKQVASSSPAAPKKDAPAAAGTNKPTGTKKPTDKKNQ